MACSPAVKDWRLIELKGFPMDTRAFDRLTKDLGQGQTRRAGIRAMVVGLLTGFRVMAADAGPARRHEKLACRNANSQCTSGDQCCSGKCVAKPEGGTGFRCAARHAKRKSGGGDGDRLVAIGSPCGAGVGRCAEGECQPFDTAISGVPSGRYCLYNRGHACGMPSVESLTCASGYCAFTQLPDLLTGTCGQTALVADCLGHNSCTGDVLSLNQPNSLPMLTCIDTGAGIAAVDVADPGGACSDDGDCAYDQVCVTVNGIQGTACDMFLDQGSCYFGFYSCDPNEQPQTACPSRPDYDVVTCTQWASGGPYFCNYAQG